MSNTVEYYKVGADGKAPENAPVGAMIVTAGGVYQKQADGPGKLVDANVTTSNFGGTYAGSENTGGSGGNNSNYASGYIENGRSWQAPGVTGVVKRGNDYYNGNYRVENLVQDDTQDYAAMMKDAMANNADPAYVQQLVDFRNAKIQGDPTLSQYENDTLTKQAMGYIGAGGNNLNGTVYGRGISSNVTPAGRGGIGSAGMAGGYDGAMDMLEQAKRAEQEALDAQIKQTINALNAKIDPARKETQNANIGAYNAYMQAANPFGANAQGMANLGLGNSGFAETNLANLGNAYQGAVNANENTLQQYLNDIELAIEDAKLTGNIEKANALAAYSQMIAQQMIENQNNLFNQNLALQQMQMEQDAQAKNWQMEQAQTLAQYGDFSGYRALGYTDDQIKMMTNAYQAMLAADAAKGRGRDPETKDDEKFDRDLIDMKSLQAIGLGNLEGYSDEELQDALYRLTDVEGVLTSTPVNGKTYFAKNPSSLYW